MLRLHEGWDYTLYRVYIIAGLGALMVGPVLAALIFGDRFPFTDYSFPYMLGLTGWILGILLYWWWVFLVKDSRELRMRTSSTLDQVPPISALQNLNRLHQAMIIHGGDTEAWRKAHWAGKRPLLEFYGWLTLLVVWIFGVVWASMLDLFPEVDPVIGPAGVVVIVLILIIRLPFLVGRSAEGFAETYLKPLGLSMEESPTIKPQLLAFLIGGQAVIPEGPVIIEGQRLGRSIRIELLDRNMSTLVQQKTPNFVLHSPDGKVQFTGEAQESVRKAIKPLRKARRWKGIRVEGGSDGITIMRDSRRQNMWLYDLWLAEHLLKKMELEIKEY